MPIPEIQQYQDLQAEKAAAKNLVLAALGRIRLAELQGRDTEADYQIIREQGIESGIEGVKMKAAQALADKVVEEHSELFDHLEPDSDPDEWQRKVVLLIHSLKVSGLRDEATLLEMYELAHFERQHIGGRTQAVLRIGGGQ